MNFTTHHKIIKMIGTAILQEDLIGQVIQSLLDRVTIPIQVLMSAVGPSEESETKQVKKGSNNKGKASLSPKNKNWKKVALLLVLMFSVYRVFSGKVRDPITKLEYHAEYMHCKQMYVLTEYLDDVNVKTMKDCSDFEINHMKSLIFDCIQEGRKRFVLLDDELQEIIHDLKEINPKETFESHFDNYLNNHLDECPSDFLKGYDFEIKNQQQKIIEEAQKRYNEKRNKWAFWR